MYQRSLMSRWSLPIIILLALFIVGCNNREDNLIGRWEPVTVNGNELAFEFLEGGTLIMTSGGRNFSGTYDFIEGNQIQVIVSGDLGATSFLLTDVELSRDSLVFFVNGEGPAEFVRVK